MKAPGPATGESFSRMVWSAPTREPAILRPGWLAAMVAEAQEQLHQGMVPVEAPLQRRRSPITVQLPQTLPQPAPTTTPLPPPTLQHIVREDLNDIRRLCTLYHQAVQQRLIGTAEEERLTFLALAQHVLSCRAENVGGLFKHLLKQKRYQCVTQADEDAALRQLKQHLYGRG